MQTVQGIRFLPLARLDGTLLGLDARWLTPQGLAIPLLLMLATAYGPLCDPTLPLWAQVAITVSSVVAVALTSLSHELGHAILGRLAGLEIRAIVLAPQGGVTIRSLSQSAQANLLTALAGPLVNALLGTACLLAAASTDARSIALLLLELAALQWLTALLNLVPVGNTDGAHALSAWRCAPWPPALARIANPAPNA